MHVEIYEDTAGEWRWRLVSGNGKTVADSAEGYASKRNVRRAWERLERQLIETATIDHALIPMRIIGDDVEWVTP